MFSGKTITWIVLAFLSAAPFEVSAQIEVGAPYDQAQAQVMSGKLIEHRESTEDESVYIHERASFVVWTQGPKRGHVYRILQKKEAARFTPPSPQEFFQKLDTEINRYSKASNMSSGEIWEGWKVSEKMRVAVDLSVYFYRLFDVEKHGDFHFWDAQYFSFPHEQMEMMQLYLQLQKISVETFIMNHSAKVLLIPKLQGKVKSLPHDSELSQSYALFVECLRGKNEQALIKESNIVNECTPGGEPFSGILKKGEEDFFSHKKSFSSYQSITKKNLLPLLISLSKLSDAEVEEFVTTTKLGYDLYPKVSQIVGSPVGSVVAKRVFITPEAKSDTAQMPTGKLVLTHGTSSRKLPNLIQVGAITSLDGAIAKGIVKSWGGERGGETAQDFDRISFWGGGGANGGPLLQLGYGNREGLEFPISFAVSEEKAKTSDCASIFAQIQWRGGIAGEVISRYPWPLTCIDHLFVPWFAIDDIRDILSQHHLGHIRVLPYSQEIFKEYGR